MKKEKDLIGYACETFEIPCHYSKTMDLRMKSDLYGTPRLQQRWQGSDGSEYWEEIEYVD